MKNKKFFSNKEKEIDEAIIWQKLAEGLVKIYKGEYSYTNIIEALNVAKAVFYKELKEE